MSDLQVGGFWDKAKTLGAAAAIAAGTALAGKAADRAFSGVMEMIDQRRARASMSSYIDAMPEHIKQRTFGEMPKENILHRYDTIYSIAPDYMKNPDLAIHALHRSIGYDGSNDIGVGLTPEASTEFIRLSNSMSSGRMDSPGIMENTLRSIGSGLSSSMIQEHAGRILDDQKTEMQLQRQVVMEDAQRHLDAVKQLDKKILETELAMKSFGAGADPAAMRSRSHDLQMMQQMRDSHMNKYKEGVPLQKNAGYFGRSQPLGTEPDILSGVIPIPDEERESILRQHYADLGARDRSDPVAYGKSIGRGAALALGGLGGISGALLGGEFGVPGAVVGGLIGGGIGAAGGFGLGSVARMDQEIYNDTLDEAQRRSQEDAAKLRIILHQLAHDRAEQNMERQHQQSLETARAAAPKVPANMVVIKNQVGAEKQAAADLLSFLVGREYKPLKKEASISTAEFFVQDRKKYQEERGSGRW